MSFYDAIRVGASGASGDLEIQRSLRFNSEDSPYLNRTPSSASNRKTFTFSFWVKRAKLGIYSTIFGMQYSGSANQFVIRFDNTDKLSVFDYQSSSMQMYLLSDALFRDVAAWYHIVVAVDTTQSTASNRGRIYINNNELTSFSTETNPSQNHDTIINTTNTHYIGQKNSGSYFDGYLAEFNFIDGLQLTPSSFGETNVETGQWNAKKYAGAYGTNGFRLTFEDNSNNAALGTDTSGNGNTYTVNNISSSHDTLIDTPSNNFCVFNELNRTNDANLTDGNLIFTQSSNDESVTGTFGIDSGKWYWEVYKKSTENPELGIETNERVLSNKTDDVSPTKVCFRTNGGDQQVGTGTPTSVPGSSGGQTGAGVIRIAVDFDNKKIWYSDLSGNFFNSGNPATGSNAAFDFSSVAVANGCVPYFFCGTGANDSIFVNFGADSSFGGNLTGNEVQSNTDGNGNGLFKYSVPSGYLALCSANIPDPTIKLPNKHFDTLLYTGNGTGQTLSGLNFSPDWLWIKSRTSTEPHELNDQVRGPLKSLSTNSTSGENTASGRVEAFTSDGFTLGNSGNVNSNSENFVAWNWNGGDTDSATYRVVVVSDSGNKYRFRNSANSATFAQSAVTLNLAEGGTYTFDGSDSTMASHPIKLSTTSDGTHGGGSSYNTGVTYELDGSTVTESAYVSGYSSATSRKLIITVAASAPTLYYYCHVHSGMGGQANTNSTLGSTNFDGSVKSIVKANTSAGFSIIKYTSTNSDLTFGHGLGVKPAWVLIKNYQYSGGVNWVTWHEELGNSTILRINLNDAPFSNSNYIVPTATTIGGKGGTALSNSSNEVIVYCFSEVAGFSRFGKYQGNNANGNNAFVFCGFKPEWIMIKASGNGGDSYRWVIHDATREPFNPTLRRISPNKTDVESTFTGTTALIDFLSNGFKIRGNGSLMGANVQYVFYAFAKSPFKYSRAG